MSLHWGNECWVCKNLRHCSKLKPCNDFVEIKYITAKEVSQKLGVGERQYYRIKDKYGVDYIVQKMRELGFTIDYELQLDRYRILLYKEEI